MVHLLIPLALSIVMYNLFTVAHAYRGAAWSGQGVPYPPGGYHHQPMSGWAPQIPPKFSPAPSANSPSYFTTPKLTTLPMRWNAVPRAECRDGDKVYKPGDKWTPPGGCGRHSCTTAGKTTVLGCPTPEPQSNCSLRELDPRHPWPFCCPRLDCA